MALRLMLSGSGGRRGVASRRGAAGPPPQRARLAVLPRPAPGQVGARPPRGELPRGAAQVAPLRQTLHRAEVAAPEPQLTAAQKTAPAPELEAPPLPEREGDDEASGLRAPEEPLGVHVPGDGARAVLAQAQAAAIRPALRGGHAAEWHAERHHLLQPWGERLQPCSHATVPVGARARLLHRPRGLPGDGPPLPRGCFHSTPCSAPLRSRSATRAASAPGGRAAKQRRASSTRT